MLFMSIGMFAPVIINIWVGIPIAILCFPGIRWSFKKSNHYYLIDKAGK